MSNNPQIKFLIDTGATVSLLKENILVKDCKITNYDSINLLGISPTTVKTLGTLLTPLILSPAANYSYQIFHIVDASFPIETDGILGMDFLENNSAVIDFEKRGMSVGQNVWVDFEVKSHVTPTEVNNIQVGSFNSFQEIPSNNKLDNDNHLVSNSSLGRINLDSLDSININLSSNRNISNNTNENKNTSVKNGIPIPRVKESLMSLILHVREEPSEPVPSRNNDTLPLPLNRDQRLLEKVSIDTTDATQKSVLQSLIVRFSDVFHLSGEKLSATDIVQHTIPILPNKAPIFSRQYRMGPSHEKEIRRQVTELLEDGIISHSSSAWSSPLLLVSKKSDTPGEIAYRMVVDYRKLNAITIPDRFPMGLIADILDRVNGSKYYTKFDLHQGFFQISISPSDRCKTAFSYSGGHYEFNRVPFGLRSGPSVFNRLMTFVLRDLVEKGICFVYMDDIIILGHTESKHFKNIKLVLDTLRLNNLRLKPSKCVFMARKMIYLGYEISEAGVSPDPEKVRVLKDFKVKRTVTGIRAFLGSLSYYRRHTKGFAEIAQPLYRLLKKDVKFEWTPQCDQAVDTLKESLINDCLLRTPNFDIGFILSTDASQHSLGGVLTQEYTEESHLPNKGPVKVEHPLGFYSRAFRDSEKGYSVIEKEFLAIIASVQHFRCYLVGAKVKTKIITDHQPLVYIFNLKESSTRLMKWCLKLEQYNFEIIYRPGSANLPADMLSRIEPPKSSLLHFKVVNAITRSKSRNLADNSDLRTSDGLSDQTVTPIGDVSLDSPINSLDSPSNSNITASSNDTEPNVVGSPIVIDEAQPDVVINDDPNVMNLDPSNEQEIMDIIKMFHSSIFGGHQGSSRTLARIKEYYSWPNMMRDIRTYIRSCPICQKVKFMGSTKAPLMIPDTSKCAWNRLSIDLCGPLNVTEKGNKYILTCQDDLTKFVIVSAIPNQEAESVARALIDNVFLVFGSPSGLLSDLGTNFMSKLFAAVCKFWKLRHDKTTAYHPESNSQLERHHFYLKNFLRAYTNNRQDDWDEWLKAATYSYNTTPHSTSNISPYELLFGRKAHLPTSMNRTPEIVYNYDCYLTNLKNKLQISHALARDNFLQSKEKSKLLYDRNAVETTYSVGDQVLLKVSRNSLGKGLTAKWEGPYVVISVPSINGTVIQINRKFRRYHNNLLKHYISPDIHLISTCCTTERCVCPTQT